MERDAEVRSRRTGPASSTEQGTARPQSAPQAHLASQFNAELSTVAVQLLIPNQLSRSVVLELQRLSGNRHVVQLLSVGHGQANRPAVQRLLTHTISAD